MKNSILKNIVYIFILFTLILSSACYKYPDMEDVSYKDYRRLIGPEGGKINFYKNYENDSSDVILVTMDFPENSLDSFVVFNMYQFYDETMNNDLELLDMAVQTKFLYFVPFYKSYGYNEQSIEDAEYHLSIDFHHPVTITYNVEEDLGEGVENELNMPRLYRIKIPELGEWDQNVWVNWNHQGYPDGYHNNDLIYLINGRWTESGWGEGVFGLTNWELVTIYTYNNNNKTVTFNINNTDYIYVMASLSTNLPF